MRVVIAARDKNEIAEKSRAHTHRTHTHAHETNMALLVAPFLVAVVIGLCFVNFLRNLYQARRTISITTTTLRAGGKVERRIRSYPQPPGPTPWPVLGNLITLGQYEVPFVGLTEMAKTYGDCYSLTLGSTRCLVVNNLELIREVLNQNGKFFGGRPDFLRFHTLFGGDRANCKCF